MLNLGPIFLFGDVQLPKILNFVLNFYTSQYLSASEDDNFDKLPSYRNKLARHNCIYVKFTIIIIYFRT